MGIHLEIPDGFFKQNEIDKLISLFDLKDESEFTVALNKIVLAALEEYRDMFLGMGLPSRADEIRQYRLYYLIKRYFEGRIPDELEVSSIFQLPESRSKSLILYVLTRFRHNLESEIFNTLRMIIQDAQEIGDGVEYRVFIPSSNMVDELNRIIAWSGVRYKQLSKVRSETNLYAIAPDSFDLILKHLKLEKPKRKK